MRNGGIDSIGDRDREVGGAPDHPDRREGKHQPDPGDAGGGQVRHRASLSTCQRVANNRVGHIDPIISSRAAVGQSFPCPLPPSPHPPFIPCHAYLRPPPPPLLRHHGRHRRHHRLRHLHERVDRGPASRQRRADDRCLGARGRDRDDRRALLRRTWRPTAEGRGRLCLPERGVRPPARVPLCLGAPPGDGHRSDGGRGRHLRDLRHLAARPLSRPDQAASPSAPSCSSRPSTSSASPPAP